MTPSHALGSALLITGTAIGAGMLGIPLAVAQLGFWPTLVLMCLIWGFSYLAALLMLEVTVNITGDNLHLNAMAYQTLGRFGQTLTWICVMGLLYSLTVAYISGGGSILFALFEKRSIHLPEWGWQTLFTLVLGLFVVTSTRATDLLNRSLFSVKTLLLILMLSLSLPSVDPANLALTPIDYSLALAAIPVIFVSFGFHHIIPSLAQYNHYEILPLKKIIFWGSILPLLIYILWLLMTLGVLPQAGELSFASIQSGDVGEFIVALSTVLHHPILVLVIQTFANFALITSFLGVTLGLFDFLRDTFNVGQEDTLKRSYMAALTFLIPLGFAMTLPGHFIALLRLGGMFLAVMAFILPSLMVMKLRKTTPEAFFKVSGGLFTPILVAFFGISVVLMTFIL